MTLCQWCGKAVVQYSGKWYHVIYGFWCWDNTGKRHAPKPDLPIIDAKPEEKP